MRHLDLGRFAWLFVIMSAAVFAADKWWHAVPATDYWGLVNLLPDVVAFDTAFALGFGQWFWKWRIFSWWVPFPNLSGTWTGEIQTTWKDEKTGKTPGPIPVMLVIRQTFNNIHCKMVTAEMASDSYSADFLLDSAAGVRRLVYSYQSNPKATLAHRSQPHEGTIKLDILDGRPRELKGPYWTLRKSTGEVALRFHSDKHLERLPKRLGPHPMTALDAAQTSQHS